MQEENKVDITRQCQQRFKKGNSTMTLSADLQTVIARALDDDEFSLVASLDLLAAFDVVNIKLLIKRMKTIGLTDDLIELVKVLLENKKLYVSLNGKSSYMFNVLLETV
jgi:hypothetical protein